LVTSIKGCHADVKGSVAVAFYEWSCRINPYGAEEFGVLVK
jgi:hypothetical protein